MKYLWRFYFDCGRSGSLDGLFVATEEEIMFAIGKDVHFGEALGKHSEVYGTLKTSQMDKVNLDSATVEKVAEILGDNWSGFNPLDYIRCGECRERASELGGVRSFVDGYCKYCVEEREREDNDN